MKHFITLISFFLTVSLTTSLMAETYYMETSNKIDTHWGTASWVDGGTTYYTWTSHEAAKSGNDYVINAGCVMRTPYNDLAASDPTNVFPGNSLTVGNTASGGSFSMKGNATFNNLTIYNGSIGNAKMPCTIVEIAGNLNVSKYAGIQTTGDYYISTAEYYQKDTRSIQVSSKITGEAGTSLSLETNPISSIWITNSANNFSGTVTVKSHSNIYLYKDSVNGKLGDDAQVVLTDRTSKLYINSDQTFASVTSNLGSGQSDTKVTLPTLTVTADNQEALELFGITAPVGVKITTDRAPATYYLTNSNVSSEKSWDDPTAWSTEKTGGAACGGIPTVGDTVHIENWTLRMMEILNSNAPQYFLAEVWLDSGGGLGLKTTSETVYPVIPNLILNGGSFGHWGAGKTILDGNIKVLKNATIQNSAANNVGQTERQIEIRSNISGSGNLTFTHGSYDTGKASIILTGDNSGYTGTMTLLTPSNSLPVWLEVTNDNSLGAGTVVMQSGSKLTIGGKQSIAALNSTADAGKTNTVVVNGSLTAKTMTLAGNATAFQGTGTTTVTDSMSLTGTTYTFAGNVNAKNLTIKPAAGYTKGTFTTTVAFANGLTTENLTLDAAQIKVTGGDVSIGTEARTSSLWIPYVKTTYLDTKSPQENYKTELDLSGANTATINVKHLEVGTIENGKDVGPQGTLKLAKTSTVNAETMTIGSSTNVGGGNGVLTLGATQTTLNVDNIYISGGVYYVSDGTARYGTKYAGTLSAPSGSVVNINALTTSQKGANLYIGSNYSNTGGGANGTVNLNGIAASSVLNFNTVKIASIGTGSGDQCNTTSGTFSMNQGTVNMQDLILCDGKAATTDRTNKTTANFNLTGGTLNVKNVRQGTRTGTETVNFNFTGGTLNVENWGTETIPLALTQKGGVLTTSDDAKALTIYGDYKQTAGTLRLNIDQVLKVVGDLSLLSLEMDAQDGFEFDENAIYKVIESDSASSLDWSKIAVKAVGELAGQTLVGASVGNFGYIGTQSAIANNLPEPATWVLFLTGILGFVFKRKK